jgi:hypothetical protein
MAIFYHLPSGSVFGTHSSCELLTFDIHGEILISSSAEQFCPASFDVVLAFLRIHSSLIIRSVQSAHPELSKWGRSKPVAAAKRLSKFDTKTFLSTIDGGRKIVAVPKKQTIFVQGDSSDAVFYIQKGKIKLTVVSKSGKEATIGILNEGRLLRRRLPYRAAAPPVFRDRNDRLLGDANR